MSPLTHCLNPRVEALEVVEQGDDRLWSRRELCSSSPLQTRSVRPEFSSHVSATTHVS